MDAETMAMAILGGDDAMPTQVTAPHARRRHEQPDARVIHAVNEFASGVQLMEELEPKQEAHVGDLVRELVLALQSQARTRPHPLLYVNLGFVLTLAFWMGVNWQRVNTLETTVASYKNAEAMVARVETVTNELGEMRSDMKALRDRLDRFMDTRPKGER